MPGVPTMYHYLLQRAREEEASKSKPGSMFSRSARTSASKLPAVRLCVSAGAIMPATLNREFEEFFSVPLLAGFGHHETSTTVTMDWPVGGRVLWVCGLPVPGLAVRIIYPASWNDAPL